MKVLTVLNKRNSNGNTTRYVNFLYLFKLLINLNRFKCKAKILGNFLIRILKRKFKFRT